MSSSISVRSFGQVPSEPITLRRFVSDLSVVPNTGSGLFTPGTYGSSATVAQVATNASDRVLRVQEVKVDHNNLLNYDPDQHINWGDADKDMYCNILRLSNNRHFCRVFKTPQLWNESHDVEIVGGNLIFKTNFDQRPLHLQLRKTPVNAQSNTTFYGNCVIQPPGESRNNHVGYFVHVVSSNITPVKLYRKTSITRNIIEQYWNNSLRMWIDTTGIITTRDGISTPSDERLKSDIQDATPQKDRVRNIRPKSFTIFGNRELGVVAQEIETTFPEIVSTKDQVQLDDGEVLNSVKSVDYEQLHLILFKSLQELMDDLDDLDARLQPYE